MEIKNLLNKEREVEEVIFPAKGIAEVYPAKVEKILAAGGFEVVKAKKPRKKVAPKKRGRPRKAGRPRKK